MQVLDRIGRIATTKINWRGRVSEELQFKTSITRSQDGTEQREAMRRNPRLTLQFGTVLTQAGLQRHMADLAAGSSELFYLPFSWRNVDLDSPATAGSAILEVVEVPFWLVPGSLIVISDGATEEAAEVASVSGTTVTLVADLSLGYAAGSRVNQAYLARAQDNVQFEATLSGLWQGNIRYDVDPGSLAEAAPTSTPGTFEGREVWMEKPNWRRAPRLQFEGERSVFDPGRGKIALAAWENDIKQTVTLEYTGLNRDRSEALIAFFKRMKGRRTGFYMPTWADDVPVETTSLAGTSSLEVTGGGFRAAYENSRVYNVLAARWSGGSYQVNRVVGFADAGGNTSLTMRDAWAQDVTPETTISFCPQWRFASDTLSVEWQTDTVAEVEFPMMAIPNEEDV